MTDIERFQSAPPHGGRPETGGSQLGCLHVSIRAPARGATLCQACGRRAATVSIRAPARGATRRQSGGGGRLGGFNPRPRTGGDAT